MKAKLIMLMAAVLGISSLINGSLMIIDPEQWYWMVPGVPDRGPFNQHFLRDIGFIYMLIGLAFVYGAFNQVNRIALWFIPTAWLVAHAIFHLWEIAVGICGPEFFIQDFPGVTLPALIAIWLVLKTKAQQANVK